jgi:hypothetical protein
MMQGTSHCDDVRSAADMRAVLLFCHRLFPPAAPEPHHRSLSGRAREDRPAKRLYKDAEQRTKSTAQLIRRPCSLHVLLGLIPAGCRRAEVPGAIKPACCCCMRCCNIMGSMHRSCNCCCHGCPCQLLLPLLGFSHLLIVAVNI